ncbi:type II secretion system F family protein [Streptomyces celluloflavus]|uniref:type II secretion system F family protein n=1 Tax=Streptomyces celluloflavus TaxID=58344 RepID=UPI003657289A
MSPEAVHRLGVAVAAALVVLCATALVHEVRRGRAVRQRTLGVLGGGQDGLAVGDRSRPRRSTAAGWRSRGRRALCAAEGGGAKDGRRQDSDPRTVDRPSGGLTAWWGPLGVVAFVAVLVGGAGGIVAGLAAGYGAHRWLTRQRAVAARQSAQDRVRAELAPAGDLLAACLAAGAGPQESAEAVGRSLDGPVGERLRHVAAELRLGGEPAVVWPRLAALPGAEGLARCMERAGISGVPAVESAARIAAELRTEWGRTAAARARRAGVLVTLPLSACFLPAFLMLGVAPVLIGLADGLLGRN